MASLKDMLIGLQDTVENDLSILASILSKMIDQITKARVLVGLVVKHGGESEDTIYGMLSVQIFIPKTGKTIWARQKRTNVGQFRYPPIKSWVHVYSYYEDMYEYEGAYLPIAQFDYPGLKADYKQFEKIGFVNNTTNKFSGWVEKVRAKPDLKRILDSSDKFLVWYDEENKRLEHRVIDGWEISLATGNNGKIIIGNKNSKTDIVDQKTDIEFQCGQTGKLLAKTGGVDMQCGDTGKFLAKAGEIELKAGGDAVEKSVLGETMKEKLDALFDHLISHTHTVTAIGSPTGPPSTAGDISTLKSELPNILSKKIKHN